METKKIIAATVIGTSVMTLFSHWISSVSKKNFTEPEVLRVVATENFPRTSPRLLEKASWTTHYGVGLAFTGLYSQVWERTPLKPSLASGAALGALSGVAGILGWSEAFKTDALYSAKDRQEYYTQLMLAHIVFGMGAAVGYKIFK
jgi:hypothetical protein